MAKDRSNQSAEPISVRRQPKRDVSMKLPRTDDGNVHAASGQRLNTSAAHFADAMDSVIGGATGAKRPTSQG